MGIAESKIKTVAFPEEVLDRLRCSFCMKYLSSPPIHLLTDGRNMCGRCPLPPHDVIQTFREVTLEVALSCARFPCCYKGYGCPEKFLFGHTAEHENRCVYQPFICPSSSSSACSWKGSVIQVRDHFKTNHIDMVHSKGKFELDVTMNKEDILMVADNYTTFLIGYKYEAATTTLKYDVRYFSPNSLNINFKIQLISSSNPENSINLKGDKCLPYSFNPPTFPNCFSLILNKFLAVLANPTAIEIEIILPMINPILKPNKAQTIINYEILDSLRCINCQNYLSLPIFDGPKGTVCSNCNEDYSPSKNENLHRRIMGANYPCRWNDCKTVCKGHSIHVHEFVCSFRPQKCPSRKCKALLIPANITHMQFHLGFYHNYNFFYRDIVYSTATFSKSKKLVTIVKDNEVVIIKHKKTTNDVHFLRLLSLKSDVSNVHVNLHFEHAHCKLKSKRFIIEVNKCLTIEPQQLPQCFRNKNKMLVYIEMQ